MKEKSGDEENEGKFVHHLAPYLRFNVPSKTSMSNSDNTMVEQVLTEPECEGRCRKIIVGFVAVCATGKHATILCRRGCSFNVVTEA